MPLSRRASRRKRIGRPRPAGWDRPLRKVTPTMAWAIWTAHLPGRRYRVQGTRPSLRLPLPCRRPASPS